MAAPTKTELLTMDWSYKGQPFVDCAANATVINLATMDWSYMGQPFVSIVSAEVATNTNDAFAWIDAAATQDIFGIIS